MTAPTPFTAPVTLTGPHARLEPLSHDHREALVDAVADGELWKLWYTTVPAPERMGAEIDRRLALRDAGSMNPFTVFDADGRVAGMTTFMNIDAINRRVEIGSTWTRASSQRSGLNTQCKLMPSGLPRDTAVYSITAAEWPTIQTHLQWLIDKPRSA